MKHACLLILLVCLSAAAAADAFGQSADAVKNNLQIIYDTEKAFEKSAAERGVNQAFLEFTAPDANCFFAGQVNCREYWKNRPPSPAALLWNPHIVDVSANGALAYTTGSSVYKPKGRDDAEEYHGQYATVWQRQPDGRYLAVLDIGISHAKPAARKTEWTSAADAGGDANEKRISAADASTRFYETAARQSLSRAYKEFLAADARLLREGKQPIDGKKAVLAEYQNFKSKINFSKRTMFVGAADLAYVSDAYTIADKDGKQTEKGHFLQIWKLRGGRWQIVLDVFLPVNN